MFFCLFLNMIKRLIFSCSFLMILVATRGQQIPKWKIEEVVKSFSADNDTTYVVNFWATFCKPCNAEIPDFIRIVDKYKSKKVKLLLVSLDLPSYYPAKIKAFAKQHNYKTNIAWLNETDADRFCPMIDAKWSGAIPATIIVNNKTGYRKFFEDQVVADDFEVALKSAIGGTEMNKYLMPMNNAIGIENRDIISEVSPKTEFIKFISRDSSVYSITGGKVSTVARIDDIKIIIIENEKIFYTYSNLGSTNVKTGDTIKPNQLIGYATKDLDGEVAVELYKNDSEGNSIRLTNNNFISRKDKKF